MKPKEEPDVRNPDTNESGNVVATSGTLSVMGPSISGRMELDTDSALVRRARDGEFAAFETLFERYRTLVFRFAYQMVPRRDDAEDMVQEAFVRAYQNLDKYRDEAKFTTWLLRIVTNLCTDQARMSNRRQALEQQEAKGSLVWMTVGNWDDPVQNLENDRRKEALRRALAALPVHHRSVIVLRDIEERDYTDIASILGCTIGGAKLRVLRARRALKDRIAPLLEEDRS
ncbi:MAG TPA: sigma-70 family RNA polymerase sigma factor [Fimbriimonadaceae bacterium]|nr:sigma-70 family RNA polymerase sigma factor [Fimbriimonadaceae bacterium]